MSFDALGVHRLSNAQGMQVLIAEQGATLVSWQALDRHGQLSDVLLGFADAEGYRHNEPCFGGLVGRYANRIAQGRFTLDGVDYPLDCNDGDNHLHGGAAGFHLQRWQACPTAGGVQLRLRSPASRYPGNLDVTVEYRLDDEGRLSIEYLAQSDAPTPINLTSHGYFNLGAGTVDEHILRIDADRYLPVDAGGIPCGPAADVNASPFDFRQPAAMGERLRQAHPQLALMGGFDHCYCLAPATPAEGALREVAWVYHPPSGRRLAVATTAAGLQFYTGNKLAGVVGRDAAPYRKHAGFCLETQAYPDQVNGPDAEAVILRPGQTYHQLTVYHLSIQTS
jgi:aldose 1-epimerase